MINDLITMLRNIFLRHKGVYTFRYQGTLRNNAQNNYKDIQVYVSDVVYNNLNITTNIFTTEFEIYILKQPTDSTNEGVLQSQDECMTVAIDVIGYLDYNEQYRGRISLHDYSITTVAHYTDDDSAGVRLSLTLELPSPLNLCLIDDNFDDEPHEDIPNDEDITIQTNEDKQITLKPIRLL